MTAPSHARADRFVGITIVIPTVDEAASLPDLLERLATSLPPHAEIVVVDDASRDGTPELARRIARDRSLPLRVIERDELSPSLASAIVAGAKAGRGDVTVVLDADGAHDPADVPRLARAVASGDADVAIGSRYVEGAGIAGWPLHRRALSLCGTWLARPLTGVADPLSGFFACRRALLTDLDAPDLRGFKVLVELLARIRIARIDGASRVVEVPIVFRDRRGGTSKLHPRTLVAFVLQLIRLRRARRAAASLSFRRPEA